jgi:type I restriction enzyme S subunit
MSRIAISLAKHFPGNEYYGCQIGALLTAYADSGLASPHIINEIGTGDAGKLWARVWEAMLYDHLRRLGFQFLNPGMTKAGEHGPDFCVAYQDRIIWIEAVVPAPEGIPTTYLQPPQKRKVTLRPIPDEELLLRWTTVLSDKRKKLESYKQQGVIGEKDCTIIAVNSCRLYDWRPNDLGSSRFAFAVEAVFPIGHLAYPISVGGEPDGEPANVPRYEIAKSNNSSVPTTSFLNPEYANVSALLGCYHKPMINPGYQRTGTISLTLVHNPCATIPLPRGIFSVEKEYVVEKDGDRGYTLFLYANV